METTDFIFILLFSDNMIVVLALVFVLAPLGLAGPTSEASSGQPDRHNYFDGDLMV